MSEEVPSSDAPFEAPRPKAVALQAFGSRRRIQNPFEGRMDTRKRRRFKAATRELPKCPGVYFFHGHDDRLLYVGKAKCLRERVRSYFADTSLPRPNKIKRLLAEITRMHVQPCGSELEALLLERRLIADLQPLLNRQLKRFHVYPYLLLSDEEFPRLTVTRSEPVGEEKADGKKKPEEGDEEDTAFVPSSFRLQSSLPLETPLPGSVPGLYLGPFTTPRHAYWTLEAMRSVFPLRVCDDYESKRGRGCIYGEIGRCAAPCVDKTPPAAYFQMCDDLTTLLRTGQSPVLDGMRERMMRYAEDLRFEDAQEIKQQIEAIEHVAARLHRLEAMRARNNVIIAQPALPADDGSPRRTFFLVRNGAVRRHLVLPVAGEWDELRAAIREIFDSPLPVAPFTAKAELDEMLILDRWLRSNGEGTCCAWMNDRSNRQWISNAVRRLKKGDEPSSCQDAQKAELGSEEISPDASGESTSAT